MVSTEVLQVISEITLPIVAGSLTAYLALSVGARLAKLFQSFNDPK